MISTTEQVKAQPKKIINGMEFISIAGELWRKYTYNTEHGLVDVVVDNPAWLFVRPSGAHTIIGKKWNDCLYAKGFRVFSMAK